MNTSFVRLPSPPPRYDQRDQAELRRAIETFLSSVQGRANAGASGSGGAGGVTLPIDQSDVTGLVDALAAKLTQAVADTLYAEISHTHAASAIVSGTLDQARLGSGSTGAGEKFLADDQTYKAPEDAVDSHGLRADRPFILLTFTKRSSPIDSVGIAAITTVGSLAFPAFATTNVLTLNSRAQYSGTTSTNQQAGFRTPSAGDFMPALGYRYRLIFAQEANINGGRCFLGLCSTNSSTLLTNDPSASIDLIGVGYDAGDSNTGNWQVIRNDGTGTASKTDTGVPRDTTTLLRLEMDSENGTSVTVRLIDLTTGAVAYSGTFTTDLPSITISTRIFSQMHNVATGVAPILSFAQLTVHHGSKF